MIDTCRTMKEPKEIKPVNISRNDKAYLRFLKLLNRIKPREEFVEKGVTIQELGEMLSSFYVTSLNDARLAGYKVWVKNNKSRILKDLKRMKMCKTVIAPDNAIKLETFDSFVEAIYELQKTNSFE